MRLSTLDLLLRAVGASLVLLVAPATAQEISEAAYLGGVDGAVQACAAAYPQRAAIYRGTVQRLVGCHLSDAEIVAWRRRLRDSAATRAQYADGLAQALNSVSTHPASRARQCASLEAMRCDPAAKPSSPP